MRTASIADQPAAPAASPTPDDRIVDTETDENPVRSETAVPPAGRPGSESPAPIELSELDALKLISDFCHPKRAELLPRLGPEYAQRGLAIEQSATGQWILRDAGWTRLRELEAERKSRANRRKRSSRIRSTFRSFCAARRKSRRRRSSRSSRSISHSRVDLEPPEVVDGKLQTRIPLEEDEPRSRRRCSRSTPARSPIAKRSARPRAAAICTSRRNRSSDRRRPRFSRAARHAGAGGRSRGARMNGRGDWMQTATGRQFWPMDPRPHEVFIEDIAHALSMICRFGGHCRRFYSVAEHSVLISSRRCCGA